MTTVADLSIPRKTWSYINTFTSFRIPTGLDIHNRQRGPTYVSSDSQCQRGSKSSAQACLQVWERPHPARSYATRLNASFEAFCSRRTSTVRKPSPPLSKLCHSRPFSPLLWNEIWTTSESTLSPPSSIHYCARTSTSRPRKRTAKRAMYGSWSERFMAWSSHLASGTPPLRNGTITRLPQHQRRPLCLRQ